MPGYLAEHPYFWAILAAMAVSLDATMASAVLGLLGTRGGILRCFGATPTPEEATELRNITEKLLARIDASDAHRRDEYAFTQAVLGRTKISQFESGFLQAINRHKNIGMRQELTLDRHDFVR